MTCTTKNVNSSRTRSKSTGQEARQTHNNCAESTVWKRLEQSQADSGAQHFGRGHSRPPSTDVRKLESTGQLFEKLPSQLTPLDIASRYPSHITQNAVPPQHCPRRTPCCPLHKGSPPAVVAVPPDSRIPASMVPGRPQAHIFLPHLRDQEARKRRYGLHNQCCLSV